MKIFLNYRRNDNAHATDRLFDRLVAQFGLDGVCYDVQTIPPGVNWRSYITERIGQCDVFLATVGDRWLEELHTRDGAQDMVRFEIESALKRGIPIIPIQVGHTPLPARHQLPADIADFADYNGVLLRPGVDFTADVQRLIGRLKEIDRVLQAKVVPAVAGAGTPLDVRTVGAVTVIGILQSPEGHQAEEDVRSALWRIVDGGARLVVLDLGHLEMLSSVGLATLFALYRRLRLASGELQLCGLNPKVRELFRLMRLETLIALADSEEAAIAALQGESS